MIGEIKARHKAVQWDEPSGQGIFHGIHPLSYAYAALLVPAMPEEVQERLSVPENRPDYLLLTRFSCL
jgi:hypothetical protein